MNLSQTENQPQIVCPLVLQLGEDDTLSLLAWQHPVVGKQLIKGHLNTPEETRQICLQVFTEKTGIKTTRAPHDLGLSRNINGSEIWHFFIVPNPGTISPWPIPSVSSAEPEMRFFWHPLTEEADDEWTPWARRALALCQAKLSKLPQTQIKTLTHAANSNVVAAIRSSLDDPGKRMSVDPTHIARSLGGQDEKQWRKWMKLIRLEAIEMALNGEIEITRKGKPVDPLNFKGIYRFQSISKPDQP